MGKYIKYEIKGTYKFILGIVAILIIATTVMQLNVKETEVQGPMMFFTVVLPGLVMFGSYITAFFYIIGAFRKELYEDRGYLTFSLPLSGNQILGAKTLVAALWFLLIGALVGIYNIILSMVLHVDEWAFILKNVIKVLSQIQIGTIVVVFGLSAITTLIMIYFSIAVSRVTIRNKKVGGLWFILFLVISSVYSYLAMKINTLIPYYIDFASLKIASYNEITNYHANKIFGLPFMSGNIPGELYVGIAALLMTILVGTVMFLGTGYLIEKKIDL